MEELPEAEPPTEVELRRDDSLVLTWPDGTTARFGLEDLRRECPCAECRGRRERGLPIWPTEGSPPRLEAVGAELVGRWGVTITWNDGHATGIYSWGVLRAWAG